MNQQQLKEYTTKCHEAAKLNGWHEQERTQAEIILLIKSEMFEAFEAYRKQKYAQLMSFDLATKEGGVFKGIFEQTIKDTFEDELADTAIRIFDASGLYNEQLEEVKERTIRDLIKDYKIDSSDKFMKLLDAFDTSSTSIKGYGIRGHYLSFLLTIVLEIAKRNDIDLLRHIDLKLEYNATRGKRHGGKIL